MLLTCKATGRKCPFVAYFDFAGHEYAPGSVPDLIPFAGGARVASPSVSKLVADGVAPGLLDADAATALLGLAAGESPLRLSTAYRELAGARRTENIIRMAVSPSAPEVVLTHVRGRGAVTSLRFFLDAPADGVVVRSYDVRLRICFDGAVPPCQVEASVATAFGAMVREFATRPFAESPLAPGLFAGRTAAGEYYLHFPMPFFKSVTVSLRWEPTHAPPWNKTEGPPAPPGIGPGAKPLHVTATVEVALNNSLYDPAHTAHFVVQENVRFSNPKGSYAPWLDAPTGAWGHIVGVHAMVRTRVLKGDGQEGDFMIYTDQQRAPVLRGTGFEDFFGSAHTFTGEPRQPAGMHERGFGRALQGARVVRHDHVHPLQLEAYRYFLSDFIPFHDGAVGVHETGGRPNGVLGLDSAAAVFYYTARGGVAMRPPRVPPSEMGPTVADRLRTESMNRTVSFNPIQRAGQCALHAVLRVLVGNETAERAAGYVPAAESTIVTGTSRFHGAFERSGTFMDRSFRGRSWDVSETVHRANDPVPPSTECSTFSFRGGGPLGCFIHRTFVGPEEGHRQVADVWADGKWFGRWIRSEPHSTDYALADDRFPLGLLNATVALCPVGEWSEIELAVVCPC